MKAARWPLVIFCFSLLTHIPGSQSPILDYHAWAQTLRAALARNYYEGGMRLLSLEPDYIETDTHNKASQFPLYSYLIAVGYLLFGFHDVFGRWLSMLFAALSAAALYRLVRDLENEETAIAAALVFCVIPIRIYFMRTVMPEAMAVFCLVQGFHEIVHWAKSGVFLPHGIAGALLLALVPLLKIAYLPLVLVPYLWMLIEKREMSGLHFFLSLALIGSIVSSWYLYANYGTERSARFIQQVVSETSLFKEWMSAEFWSTHFLSRFPELLTTYGGLVFFIAGFWKFWSDCTAKICRHSPGISAREPTVVPLIRLRRTSLPSATGDCLQILAVPWSEHASFWLIWFALTIIYIALSGEYGRIHQYVSLPFAPVNAVFISSGMFVLFRSFRTKRIVLALWMLLILSIPVHAAFRIHKWYRLEDTWIFKARETTDRVSKPSDLFFVNSPNQPFYLYHLHRKGYVSNLEGQGLEIFERALGKGVHYLFTPVHETGQHWTELEPKIAKRFELIYRDADFSLYDLSKRP